MLARRAQDMVESLAKVATPESIARRTLYAGSPTRIVESETLVKQSPSITETSESLHAPSVLKDGSITVSIPRSCIHATANNDAPISTNNNIDNINEIKNLIPDARPNTVVTPYEK